MFILFCVLTAVLIAAGVCLVLVFRAKPPVLTVEFYPPKGVTPLQFSSYLYGEPRLKDVLVIILQWAREGFVRVEKDGVRNLKVIKLKDLPFDRPAGERIYFGALFEEGNLFSSRYMKSQLGQKRDNAINLAAKALIKE